MVVEMAVTGTVARIEYQMDEYENHQVDMLLVCELGDGAEDLKIASVGPKGMTLGVLGARVRIVDDWGLPELRKVKVGDYLYACGSWQAPGSHDLVNELLYVEAARDWYRLESWDAGEAGRLEVRAVDIIGFDVRRYIVPEARWEPLTEEWSSWRDPFADEAGWHAHRVAVSGYGNAANPAAVETLDREVESGMDAISRRRLEELSARQEAERKATLEDQKARLKARRKARTESPEVEAQKEAARTLAKRGLQGKRAKRKRRR